jgi:hypothetical protein
MAFATGPIAPVHSAAADVLRDRLDTLFRVGACVKTLRLGANDSSTNGSRVLTHTSHHEKFTTARRPNSLARAGLFYRSPRDGCVPLERVALLQSLAARVGRASRARIAVGSNVSAPEDSDGSEAHADLGTLRLYNSTCRVGPSPGNCEPARTGAIWTHSSDRAVLNTFDIADLLPGLAFRGVLERRNSFSAGRADTSARLAPPPIGVRGQATGCP